MHMKLALSVSHLLLHVRCVVVSFRVVECSNLLLFFVAIHWRVTGSGVPGNREEGFEMIVITTM